MNNLFKSKIIDYINANKVDIITLPPNCAIVKLKTDLKITDDYDIYLLGGFNNKILLVKPNADCNMSVFSISKPIKETDFFQLFGVQLCLSDDNSVSLPFDSPSFNYIKMPIRIALVSLANREVYTFPRFALGISYIAHALRNQYKSDVMLYDMQLNTSDEIVSDIIVLGVDVIGISMTFGLFDVMRTFVEKIVEQMPNTKIVIGGSLATIEYQEILAQFPNVIVSLGEGEKSMSQIVNWLYGSIKLDDILDIAYVNNDGNISTTNHATHKEGLSLPEFDLLLSTIREKGVFQLETSRGCYNACSFCPRQYKGNWRSIVNDKTGLDYFLDIYCQYLSRNGMQPTDYTIYIVDEEFIGGNSDFCQERINGICNLFHSSGIHFEASYRMNAVYAENGSKAENKNKIANMIKIRDSGLTRVLIGVESGVQSVLTRFNKNVTMTENIQGIRILTALDIPVRFTYITFDPLMSFDELIETYTFQGRKDLIMNPFKTSVIDSLLDYTVDNEKWFSMSKEIPFYYYIPYMLVSLECLIGSNYYNNLNTTGMLQDTTITALGKKNATYADWRVGLLSKYSQLWIDRNFSLDYTLKSLGKIYPRAKSEEIRSVRTKLKNNAYRLLGKMIFLFHQNEDVLKGQPSIELQFFKKHPLPKLLLTDAELIVSQYLQDLLDFQFSVLTEEVHSITSSLESILCADDFALYKHHLDNWKKYTNWQLINRE